MFDPVLVERLGGLSSLAHIPREEVEWLVGHGRLELGEAGTVVARKGERVERLSIVLSGHMAIRVDRGTGPRRVAEWKSGDITGMLPYSRMSGTPGDTYFEEQTEFLSIHEEHFREMITRCPMFTAHTVHLMLDRARTFNTSDLHDEKMISLGKLAAGLAHELNNPASATVRSAKLLLESLANADIASRALAVVGLTEEEFDTIERLRTACLAKTLDPALTPIQEADRQDEIAEWLERHHADLSLAAPLADTAVTINALDSLATVISKGTLDATLQWIAASCATHRIASEIVHASSRIYELVADVKNFTHMDHLAGPEFVDVEPGLRETIRILAPRSRSKGATIMLDIEAGLPRVHITGWELNQVLLNVVDNALDAIGESGRIDIAVRRELNRVEVQIVDDGPGISSDVLPRIFDPFFTTKPPGEGTGLGLSITHKLLRRYQGDIEIRSSPGRTECRLSLEAEMPSAVETDHPSRDVMREVPGVRAENTDSDG